MSQLTEDNKQFGIIAYIKLSLEMVKLSILSAMEYRFSFLMQVFGMVINDFGLLILWMIFYERFPVVKGWTFQDTALLYATQTINFALVMIFAMGAFRLGKIITEGQLDYYLSHPKNVLWYISVSMTDIAAIGDFLFGVLVYVFFCEPTIEKTINVVAVSLISAVVLYSFIVITQSGAFFITRFEDTAEQFFWNLTNLTLYPQTVYTGALKIITLTLLPSFFIANVPVSYINYPSLELLGFMLFVSLIFLSLAVYTFNQGLKRYESGNLIQVKM